jgi:hypothetical protein
VCVTVVETEHDVHRARIGIVSDEMGRPLEPMTPAIAR